MSRADPPSLRRRFWRLYALPLVGSVLAIDALAVWGQFEGRALQAVAAAVWLGAVLWVSWMVVSGRRLWHAAAEAPTGGKGAASPRLLRAGVVAGGLLAAAALGAGALTQAWNPLQLLLGRDPRGQATLQLAPDGRRAQLSGHLGAGDAARITQMLAGAPALYLLEIDLAGARWHEARALADTLRERAVQTRIAGRCDGACAVVFLAGRGRQVNAQRGVGVHRFEVESINPLLHKAARRWSATRYRDLGMPERFVFSALGSAPGDPWLADGDALFDAGLAGVPGRPFDVALPPRAGAQTQEYADALLTRSPWRTLEQRQSGLVADAAQRMAEAQAAGADDETTQIAAQRVIEPLLTSLLDTAPPTLHEVFIGLQVEQLAAAQPMGAAACRALLAGDTQARRALPTALAADETAWLLEAAREPPYTGRRGLNALEAEITRRTLGHRGPAMLAAWRSPSAAEGCERPRAILEEIRRLSPGERQLAMRLMFRQR